MWHVHWRDNVVSQCLPKALYNSPNKQLILILSDLRPLRLGFGSVKARNWLGKKTIMGKINQHWLLVGSMKQNEVFGLDNPCIYADVPFLVCCKVMLLSPLLLLKTKVVSHTSGRNLKMNIWMRSGELDSAVGLVCKFCRDNLILFSTV